MVTEPDPLPIGYATSSPRESDTSRTSTYSVRPISDDMRNGRRANVRAAACADVPASARTTGATNSWNVKMADVGKPGRTTTPFLPLAARQIGLPGLRATPCTRMPGGPSTSSSTRTLRSPGPFDVPPERTTRSAQPSARRSVERIASASSGTMPRGNGSPPSSRTASQIITALESKICPAAIGAPGGTISSPVENTATTGFLKTETRGMPIAARRPVSRDVHVSRARSTG